MNITAKQILFCTFILTAMLSLMYVDIARTDTKENGMATTTTELPNIDLARPDVTETAIFALG